MDEERPTSETRRLERWVHWTLLLGLAVSTALLLAGLAMSLAHHEPEPAGPPPRLAELARSAASGSGVSLLDLGVLALIATPILRVVALAVGWTAAGDRRFAMIAIAVLGLLALGLSLGLG